MKLKKHKPNQVRLLKSKNLFPVVGVGASAGGLDAYRRLLRSIPQDSGMAYVLVQHLDPKHESMLADLLQKSTTIPVSEISDDITVEPDHIYIIPSNKMLTANNGSLQLSPRPPSGKGNKNLPIDLFFKSLAEVHRSHSIGVVLSGTGSDGTLGLKAIRGYGGLTFAQDEESAAYGEMPRSAVNSGVVSFILTPEQIPEKIQEMTPPSARNSRDNTDFQNDETYLVQQILSLLRIRKGTDFTYYKQTTIRRRILRRMVLNKTRALPGYLKYLEGSTDEQDLLYNDLLIPVSAFFRDDTVFDELTRSVLPSIVRNIKGEPLRIWVAGCSTGEEAYSLAICCLEIRQKKTGRVQIFATDINDLAIAKARIGLYSRSALKSVSQKRLKQFFTKTDAGYRVNNELREMCVFAVHDFLKDPPFGRMDLVTCRNVLIYMEPYLQKKALVTFHYSLNAKGFLILGKSETPSIVPELFSPVTRQSKIFSRKNVQGRFTFEKSAPVEKPVRGETITIKREITRTDFQKTANEIIMNRYTPPGVIVNEALDVVHFHGNNAAWLRFSSGKPSHNLATLSKPGLGFELRSILHKAKKEKKAIKKTNISLTVKGIQRTVTFEAIPLPNTVEPYYLLLFHGLSHNNGNSLSNNDKKSINTTERKRNSKQIEQLEHELAQTLEDMNSITEDQETAYGELQSANEELQSGSEELQSLNEEIETSKEEIQSTNEELIVVNQELGALNEQLTEERDYANGIIATVREPLVVLDRYFHVKTANKSFYETFKINKNDTEGKSFYELDDNRWDIPILRSLINTSRVKKVNFVDFEVTGEYANIGKRHMLLNAREILRDGGREKLILLAIEDVTERKEAEQILKNNEERFRHLVKDLPAAVYSCDAQGYITFYNNAAVRVWGREPELRKEQWCGSWKMIGPDGEPLPADISPMAIAIKERRAILGQEIIIERQDGTRSTVQVYPQPIFGFSGEVTGAINMAIDITEQKEASNQLRQSEEKFRQLAGELEKTVFKRTQELQLANETLVEKNAQLLKLNKELESFAYISSHDLQEPLRKIQILASHILEKDQASLSVKGLNSFASIRDSAMRMQSLIKDLLSYSRSAETGRKFERVAVNRIVREVLDEFKEVITEKKATINVGKLGDARVLPLQFRQLMYNLIGNSLKFSVPGRASRIGIKSETATGRKLEKNNQNFRTEHLSPDTTYYHISISDNGIGFEANYNEKIFVVFQRLHVTDVYPGTGIGLAIAKRIVENHRGIITASGKVNKSATFDIYIPNSPVDVP